MVRKAFFMAMTVFKPAVRVPRIPLSVSVTGWRIGPADSLGLSMSGFLPKDQRGLVAFSRM